MSEHKQRILPGSEDVQRWPGKWHIHETYRELGIPHYGKVHGLYQIPIAERNRAMGLGYEVVRVGTYYAYVKKVDAIDLERARANGQEEGEG